MKDLEIVDGRSVFERRHLAVVAILSDVLRRGDRTNRGISSGSDT